MALVQTQFTLATPPGGGLCSLGRMLAGALILVGIATVGGCAATGTPVVTDRSVTKAQGGVYVVKKGDTLYSIAWRFDLDHQRLAAANRIGPPYTIFPGQRLQLREQAPPKPRAKSESKTPTIASTQQRTPAKPSAQKKPPQSRSPEAKRKAVTPARAATKAPVSRSKSLPQDKTWHKPLPQKPSALFGSNNKGWDYAIAARADVRAARSGKVVYAGNGIAGFERLIIVQHSSELLSAYSFNGKMLVDEQQRVRGGVAIAQILPRPGVGQVLHFELRRNGKPINPQSVIP